VSYDLFFTPHAFDARAMLAWFGGRAHYDVSGPTAGYANDDTGVYFAFEINARLGSEQGEEALQPSVAFNLNFCRPHFFALEAEPELAAFSAAFPSCIEDPQTEGMGEGPYSREGFLRGWNAGNRFGFEAVGRNTTPPPPWPADPALLEAIWRWNFDRRRLQAKVGDRIFVPKLRWAVHNDAEPVACATWTEGVPTLVPEDLVTHVLMVRQQRPSLRSFLSAITGRDRASVEFKLVTLDALHADPDVAAKEIDGHALLQTPQSGAVITPGSWPRADIRILPPEEVCGADLVARMGRA
jgi:hypothetical protein